MKVIIIADTIISGKPVSASEDPIDVDDATGRLLISAYKAEEVKGVSEAALAAAAALAKQELLEKIAAAQTPEDLDELLSEDPEIAAAYEKRKLELEEPHH